MEKITFNDFKMSDTRDVVVIDGTLETVFLTIKDKPLFDHFLARLGYIIADQNTNRIYCRIRPEDDEGITSTYTVIKTNGEVESHYFTFYPLDIPDGIAWSLDLDGQLPDQILFNGLVEISSVRPDPKYWIGFGRDWYIWRGIKKRK